MPGKIRFGMFELDDETLELRKKGVRIRLQEQPLRVLALLAARPGEVITREELQQKIWGDTFVEYDQSLNKAVNRIREALNDSAAIPDYIETVPRRGYRFIAPVTTLPQRQEEPPQPASVSVPPIDTTTPSRSVRPFLTWTIVATLTAILAAMGVVYFVLRKQLSKRPQPEAKLVNPLGGWPVLSRDGKLLALGSDIGGGSLHVWVQQTAGGPAIPVTTGPYSLAIAQSGNQADFSPDGSRIVFSSEKDGGGIYVTSSFPGEPRLVVRSATGEDPRFSPTGDRVLYYQDAKAFAVPVDGGEATALPVDQNFRLDGAPFWSPDGTEILFYGRRNRELDKPADWWIVSLGGADARSIHLPGAENNISPANAVISWIRAVDGREWIVYRTSSFENWKISRVRVSARDLVDPNPELLIAGNGWLGVGGSASEDGKLAYNLWSASQSVFQLPVTDHGHMVGTNVELPLPEGGMNLALSVSHDGRWMAYDTSFLGRDNLIRLRDLSTGSERTLDDKGRTADSDEATSISPDGSRVFFERDCSEGISPENPNSPFPCSFMVAAAGGAPERVCVRCTPRGLSSDGSLLLLQKYDRSDPKKDKIVGFDLHTKTEKDFLSDPNLPLYHPFFSWDDQWVVFKQWRSVSVAQILIAPVRQGVGSAPVEWIAITDGQHSDDKPQFSADGNTVYFTSTRDGYLCIWAQRLDPATKHPVGAPTAFAHLHNSSGHYAASAAWQRSSDLVVARDKMLINLPQMHSDIWVAQVP
jgi:eukaryotic-like serine/threonine-protein kinase